MSAAPSPLAGAADRAAARAVETLALTLWAEAAERPVRAMEALAAQASPTQDRVTRGYPSQGIGGR